ncbi:MAG: SpaA isopeptide-forming pilin-related protein [Actinomycetota bacterium]|nr:SpaA isopeptide-forming pilin-related protein [Actinomycetota bacterium]
MQYSGSGKGIRFWTDKKNRGNTLVTITYASSVILPSDPYDLNGRTFGIAYHDESATSAALTTETEAVGNQQRLAGQDMLMRPDVLDNDGVLLVAENSDITEWTFESISEEKYHITTTAGGQRKYLTIDGGDVILRDEPDEDFHLYTARKVRLYLGDENSSADSIPAAGMCSYHVKDAQGDYCRWDADGQSFVSLGKKQLNALSEDEKTQATFHTSMNGSISKIPADHTVEVRDLIVGTKYKVEERDDEIPKGYTLRLGDGYARVGGDNVVTNGITPISGTIQAGEDPEIEIRNQKGWGLTVKKVWTDKDFMEAHDSTYFAVYVKNGEVANAPGTLLEGSVRQLKATEDEIYYFFSNLSSTVPFKDYIVREVTLGGRWHHRERRWGGDALPGAVFMLKDSSGGNVAAETYTSRDPDGLITIAYLSPGTYEFTEIAAPKGYMVSDAPMKIVVADDGQVTVAGVDAGFYTLTQATDTEMAAIKVKDRTTALTVKKVDADGRPLSGAHFALYDQVTDNHGNKVKDYSPKPGYDDLVSDSDGVLQTVTMDSLRAGTYYLTETQAPTGCDKLTEDLCFTIGDDGTVVIEGDEGKSWLAKSDDGAGSVAYILTIPNGKMKKVEIKKVSAENHGTLLQDASFALYAAADFDDDANTPKAGARALVQGATNAGGILPLGELPAGEYRLVETNAPAGYNLLGTPVKVFVRSDEVAASQGGNDSTVRHLDPEDADTWQIEVWNSAGYELPSTGGPGTIMMYLVGGALMLLAGTGLIFRYLHTQRRRD